MADSVTKWSIIILPRVKGKSQKSPSSLFFKIAKKKFDKLRREKI